MVTGLLQDRNRRCHLRRQGRGGRRQQQRRSVGQAARAPQRGEVTFFFFGTRSVGGCGGGFVHLESQSIPPVAGASSLAGFLMFW